MVKGIDNAFDHMELSLVLQTKAVFYIPGSKRRSPKTVLLPANPVVARFLTKQNNAFDHMELCLVLQTEVVF